MNKSEKLKKKKYFLFPKLEKKHLLFLFFFLVSLLKKTAQTYFEQKQTLAKDFLKLYMYNVGDFLSIIPFLIMKKKEKVKSINNNERIQNDDISNDFNTSKKIILIHYDQSNYTNNYGIKVKLFLYTIFDFIAQISSVIYYIIKQDEKLEVKLVNLNSSLIFSILTIILFSKIILHTDFYRHHCFSFSIDILCLTGLISIDIIQIINQNKNEDKEDIIMAIIYIIIKILSVALYSLANVLAKVMFLYDFISPYALLFFKSIIDFFYLLIFSIPFIFKKFENKSIFTMIGDIFEDKKYIFIVIGYTINSFFYNILDLQIINVFSPNHCVIARVFEYFGIFIINIIFNGVESVLFLIIKIIMYILLIFAAFVFNEFLVINICSLAKYTKLFLIYEAEKEKNNKISEENLTSSDSNNISLINESRSVSSVYE